MGSIVRLTFAVAAVAALLLAAPPTFAQSQAYLRADPGGKTSNNLSIPPLYIASGSSITLNGECKANNLGAGAPTAAVTAPNGCGGCSITSPTSATTSITSIPSGSAFSVRLTCSHSGSGLTAAKDALVVRE